MLTLAAGARRTLDAPDAYTASVGGDVGGSITQNTGRPQTAAVAALPGVSSVEAMTFLFAATGDPSDVQTSGTIVFAGSRLTTAHLLAGRPADPSKPDEFVADRTFFRTRHAKLGDRFPMMSWTQEQQAQGKAFVDPPAGPAFEGVLVGEVDAADVLNDNYTTMVFSPALLDEDIGISATLMNVRLAPGVTTSQLRQELDGLPDGAQMVLEPGRVVSTEVRNAVDAEGRGLWIIAMVAAAAAVVALGQLLSRHARLGDAEREPLVALGYTRRELTAETLGRAGVPAAVGVAVGAGIAVVASGLFPSGFVSQLEPDAGIKADPLVLAVGGLGLLIAVLAWVAVAGAAWPGPDRSGGPCRPPPRPSPATPRTPPPPPACGSPSPATAAPRPRRSARSWCWPPSCSDSSARPRSR